MSHARTTLYLDPKIRRALKVKSATMDRSIYSLRIKRSAEKELKVLPKTNLSRIVDKIQ